MKTHVSFFLRGCDNSKDSVTTSRNTFVPASGIKFGTVIVHFRSSLCIGRCFDPQFNWLFIFICTFKRVDFNNLDCYM